MHLSGHQPVDVHLPLPFLFRAASAAAWSRPRRLGRRGYTSTGMLEALGPVEGVRPSVRRSYIRGNPLARPLPSRGASEDVADPSDNASRAPRRVTAHAVAFPPPTIAGTPVAGIAADRGSGSSSIGPGGRSRNHPFRSAAANRRKSRA